MTKFNEYLEAVQNNGVVRSRVNKDSRMFFPLKLEKQMIKLGNQINTILEKKGVKAYISTFFSGYRGLAIEIPDKNVRFFLMDQSGKVGLENHQLGSIYLQIQKTKGHGVPNGSPINVKGMDFQINGDRSFGDTDMREDDRKLAYKSILNYFEKWNPEEEVTSVELKLLGNRKGEVYEVYDTQSYCTFSYEDAEKFAKKHNAIIPDIDELDDIFENFRNKVAVKEFYWSSSDKQVMSFSDGKIKEAKPNFKYRLIIVKR